MVEWRELPDCPGYEVSDDAQVRRWIGGRQQRLAEPCLVPLRSGHNGYFKFNVRTTTKVTAMDLHRAMALAFLGPPPSVSHVVDHIDRDRSHNRISNLRWVTASESGLNRSRLVRKRKHIGDAVRWAREVLKKTYAEIAKEFEIDHRTARRLCAVVACSHDAGLPGRTQPPGPHLERMCP